MKRLRNLSLRAKFVAVWLLPLPLFIYLATTLGHQCCQRSEIDPFNAEKVTHPQPGIFVLVTAERASWPPRPEIRVP